MFVSRRSAIGAVTLTTLAVFMAWLACYVWLVEADSIGGFGSCQVYPCYRGDPGRLQTVAGLLFRPLYVVDLKLRPAFWSPPAPPAIEYVAELQPLPSPSWGCVDDVQYFAPGPEYKLPNEAH